MQRPVKIDWFQFRKNAIYEIMPEKVLCLYHEYTELATGDAQIMFENGLTVCIATLGLLVYGENYTDKDLFKMRLEGKISGEIIE